MRPTVAVRRGSFSGAGLGVGQDAGLVADRRYRLLRGDSGEWAVMNPLCMHAPVSGRMGSLTGAEERLYRILTG